MIEILVGVWIACFILSALITAINIRTVLNTARSTQVRTLNWNLKKIDMFWSMSSEAIHPLTENSVQLDLKKTLRNYLLLGCLGFFSVIGFVLLLVVSISMRMLTSRQARRILSSNLTTMPDLENSMVQQLVEELKSAH